MASDAAWMELQGLLKELYTGTDDDLNLMSRIPASALQPEKRAEPDPAGDPDPVELPELDLASLSAQELHDLADGLVPQAADDSRSTWPAHTSLAEWHRTQEEEEAPGIPAA